VSFVSSSGPHNLNAGEQLEIAFALTAGANVDDLKSAAKRSREKYQSLVTGLQDEFVQPIEYSLSQNYPNPFNPVTIINFSIPKEGWATIKVFDILGREVSTLLNGNVTTGVHKVTWDGKDNIGRDVSSGIYFYSIEYNGSKLNRKMLLLR
jgi:hypothetical protein